MNIHIHCENHVFQNLKNEQKGALSKYHNCPLETFGKIVCTYVAIICD
jgi:hypothetical protein